MFLAYCNAGVLELGIGNPIEKAASALVPNKSAIENAAADAGAITHTKRRAYDTHVLIFFAERSFVADPPRDVELLSILDSFSGAILYF